MTIATQYLWILWDVGALILLTWMVRDSARRGFLATILSLLGYWLAVFAASKASPLLAELAYDNVVKDALRVVLMRRMGELLEQGGAATADLLDQIPEALRRLMTGDTLEVAGSQIESEAVQLVESIIEGALRGPVLSILQGLFFMLLFSLALLVARAFSRFFFGVYRVPVIGTVNTVLGGLIGVAKAMVVLFVAALAARLLILITGGGFFWLNEQVMDDTYLLRFFYGIVKI